MKSLTQLLCLCLLFVSISASAQLNPKGSAAELKDNLYILTVFATEDGVPWDLSSKEVLASAQYEAEEWLKSQAAAQNVNLNIRAGSFGFDTDLPLSSLDLFPQGRKRSDWIPTLLKEIGYLSPAEFHGFVQDVYSADQVIVLVYINSTGTGYTLKYDGENEDSYVEGSVICRYFTGEESPRPISIAQEILRSFDAKNLFEGSNQSSDQIQLANKLYPNDVMVKLASDIKETEIGAFTAYQIGWSDSLPADAKPLSQE